MSWIIERDAAGNPVRMIWEGPGTRPSAHNEERERMIRVNSLPMPAMREWAQRHGLIPNP